MSLIFNYSKNDTYVIGVSGGPDSMALLDMLYRQNFSLVVCSTLFSKKRVVKIDWRVSQKGRKRESLR